MLNAGKDFAARKKAERKAKATQKLEPAANGKPVKA
jgi:hypothetical protein